MPRVCLEQSILTRVRQRLSATSADVILRADVQDLAAPRQISRALKTLVQTGELIKLGRGVYTKTLQLPETQKVVIKNGFDQACLEALDRLGVAWELGSAYQAYNRGESTQIPVKLTVKLKTRFRGQLTYRDRALRFEGGTNAR